MYLSHSECTHARTTEARRQCRRALRGEDTDVVVPLDLNALLTLKRMGGEWRDTYEMINAEGVVVGTLTRVDYLEEQRTRRGSRRERVTEYRMGFRRNIDPARRFEGQGSRKITNALEMATRAYLELVAGTAPDQGEGVLVAA